MSIINISGVLASEVAANGTFTATVPLPGTAGVTSSRANFGVTTGDFHNARGHRLTINGNEYADISGFTVTLTNQSTVTITNKSGAAWAAGSSYILSLNQKGNRLYQDNDPAFARKRMNLIEAPLMLANLGMPATASATAVANGTTIGTTTSAAGIEKLTASVYLDVPRAVSITSSSASDTSSFTMKITGKDVYGQTMSETLAFNGAATVLGNKAFAVVDSIKAIHASATALTGTCTVGSTTKLGLPVFVPASGFVMKELQDGASATAGTFAYGMTTAGGSTATTGDVRGTYIPNAAPDGTKTYELLLCLPDPGNIGVAQFAG